MGAFRHGSPFAIATLAFSMILLRGAPAPKADIKVDFTPRVVIEQSYTDNFFLDPKRKVDMWVTRVAPGFDLIAKTENSVLLLDYLVGHYWHFTDERGIKASDQNFFQHELSLGVAVQPAEQWRPGFTEELIKSREPLLSEEGLGLPLTRRGLRANLIDFTRNRAKPFLNYYLSERWEAQFSYRNEIFDLSSDNPGIDRRLEDQREHRGGVTLTHNLDVLNHFDLESQFWHRDFNASDPSRPLNSDYDAYQTKLIYRRDAPGSPYEFQIGAGYQFRNFTQDVDRRKMDSIREFVFSTEFSRQTTVSRITLSLERSINDLTISNNYYASHAVRLGVQRYFKKRKLRLFGKAGYEFNDYLTNKPGTIAREDNVLELEGGGAYRLFKKGLELVLGYAYADRDSNNPALGYTENKVFLKLQAEYDFDAKWK